MNTFSIIFIAALVAGIFLEWFLLFRHKSHVQAHREAVPNAFADTIPLESHQKAADYTMAKGVLARFDILLGGIVLLLWTLGGGLEFLDQSIQRFGLSELWTGAIVIIAFMLISSIIDIPVSLYQNFSLEEKFGFNKMTLGVFFSDMIKNTLVMLALGVPILLLVLWIMQNMGNNWWLYAWITMVGFLVFMTWAYPAFIAPIFNKFKPLEDKELQARIEDLLTRNGFKSQGVFVMDGSLRSTHGNAYFAGFGSNKRIVFFDTLIEILNYDEIEAVLAHELGHFKRNHVKKLTALQFVILFVGFAALGWLINQAWFYQGLGVSQPSNYMALLLFSIVSPVFLQFIMPSIKVLTRKYEFEADDFASEQAKPADLISALVSLYKENANTLTPDPLYSAFHDSHPPAPIRIAHLNAKPS